MSLQKYVDPDGDQLHGERVAIGQGRIQTIKDFIKNPSDNAQAFIDNLDEAIEYTKYMPELLVELIDVVFASQTYLMSVGKYDIWRAQLLRLLNPISKYIPENSQQEIYSKINTQFVYINDLEKSTSQVKDTYDASLFHLAGINNEGIHLLIQIEFYHAVIEKLDPYQLIEEEEVFVDLFKKALHHNNDRTRHRGYLLIARYYLRTRSFVDQEKAFGYAQAAYLEVWYRSKNSCALSYLGDLAYMFMMHNRLDQANKLLNYWSRYRDQLGLAQNSIFDDTAYAAARGYLHYANGNYELAEKLLYEAYRGYQEIKHPQNVGRILLKLALTNIKLHKYQQALAFYRIAVHLYQELDCEEYQVFAEHGIGFAYLQMGDGANAKEILKAALAKAMHYPKVLGETIENIRGDLSKAEALL